jgi:CrcB protein
MNTVLAIAFGGSLGALARHYLNGSLSSILGGPFPWGIFFINIIGSFLMGVLLILFATHDVPSQPLRAFLAVGFLGAFTTFSTFSLDSVHLIQQGQYYQACLYIVGSVTLSILGLLFGIFCSKIVFQ